MVQQDPWLVEGKTGPGWGFTIWDTNLRRPEIRISHFTRAVGFRLTAFGLYRNIVQYALSWLEKISYIHMRSGVYLDHRVQSHSFRSGTV